MISQEVYDRNIAKAIAKYGDRFIYPKIEDVPSSTTKVKIIDKETGYEFYQELLYHTRNLPADFPKKDKTQEFISKVDPKYKYISGTVSRTTDLVIFECPEHGQAEKTIDSWMKRGCFQCSYKHRADSRKVSKEEFLKMAREKFGDRYEYDLSEYNGLQTKIKYICPEHGHRETTAIAHIRSEAGCLKCGAQLRGNNQLHDKETFVSLAQKVWGKEKFDYSEVDYSRSKEKVKIRCVEHNYWFEQIPNTHLLGNNGCPYCDNNGNSKAERSILEFVRSIADDSIEIIPNSRPYFMQRKELDIYMPSFNLAIEYNGITYHHSTPNANDKYAASFYKPPSYHFDKWKLCNNNGVRLISMPDFYWANPIKRNILEYKIRHYLNMDEKVYARKCDIVQIDNSIAKDFYNRTHIEGPGMTYKDTKSYGLMYQDKLLMAVSIGYLYNQSSKEFDLKVSRISTELGYTVIGGLSKLLKFLKSNFGNFKYHFTLDFGSSTINYFNYKIIGSRYFYVNPRTLEYHHRNYCQKHLLEKHFGEPLLPDDTETSYMSRLGYLKYYDCGIAEVIF